MESKQKVVISWILFWTFWVIFVLSCLGTLAMLFLGFGEVQDTERATLINMLIGEVSVGLIALFYSVFNLKKGAEDSPVDNDELNRLEALLVSKENEISSLKSKLEKEKSRNGQYSPSSKYRDTIKGLCSPLTDTKLEELIKKLGLDADNMSQERQKVFAEIGLMKEQGILVNQNSLYPDAVRLAKNA